MTDPKGVRISCKRSRPNPLFQEWLEELHNEAQEKNSKLEPMLKQALESISKYPLPLASGSECAILKGFEKKLCMFIDKRLEIYNIQNSNCDNTSTESNSSDERCNNNHVADKNIEPENVDAPSTSKSGLNSNGILKTKDSSTTESTCLIPPNLNPASSKFKNKKKDKTYKPALRSGSYAILISLLENSKENPHKPAINKEKLIEIAQKHSEESFTRPKPDSHYTAFSNMSRLITKGLVVKSRNKKIEYSLTEQGILLAEELLKEAATIPTVNDIIFNNGSVAETGSVNNVGQNHNAEEIISNQLNVEMLAGTFDIVLIIDKNETGGVSKKDDPTVAQFNKYPNLNHEYRSLKVGDFTWIAKHKSEDKELVLPYIIERKRMDDLGASIKDGRFHEQKFRLRRCGLRNIIYMVENYGRNKHVGLPLQSLMQALANTRIQDGFKVHVTDSLTDSARFLAMMTKRLTIEYEDKNLRGGDNEPSGDDLMTFAFFSKSSMKTKALTVTETFIKMLLQLKGVSVEKALAITKEYSTPKTLIEEYKRCSDKDGKVLLANLKYDDTGRNIGPTVSKAIYHLFTST